MKVTRTLLRLFCNSISTTRPCNITDLQWLQHELIRVRLKWIAFIKLMLCIFPLTTFLSGFPHQLCRTMHKFDRSQGKADAVAMWIVRHSITIGVEHISKYNLQPRLTHFRSSVVSLVLKTFTTAKFDQIFLLSDYMKLCTWRCTKHDTGCSELQNK